LNLNNLFGFIFVLVCFGLVIYFGVAARNRQARAWREIPAFGKLRRAVGLAVEAGTRLHISIGRGAINSPQGASGLAGTVLLERLARAASIGDRPPIATSGDGSLGILSQDTLRSAYRVMGVENQYDPNSGRVAGLTPFSFTAGTMPIIRDEQVSISVLAGNFGSEAVLMTDAAERSGSPTIGGTDNLSGQAVLYAAADETLIGEEVFAGGAYLGAGPMHEASLTMQDFVRALIVLLMIIASALNLIGIDIIK